MTHRRREQKLRNHVKIISSCLLHFKLEYALHSCRLPGERANERNWGRLFRIIFFIIKFWRERERKIPFLVRTFAEMMRIDKYQTLFIPFQLVVWQRASSKHQHHSSTYNMLANRNRCRLKTQEIKNDRSVLLLKGGTCLKLYTFKML